MDKIIIKQSEKNISNSEIKDIEQKLNVTLPSNYKKLMLKFNGGVIEKHKYLFELLSIKYGTYTVEELNNDTKVIEQNIPSDYFPFAVTATGRIITLRLKKDDDYCKVYVFYPDREEILKIADSLEELLGVEDINDL